MQNRLAIELRGISDALNLCLKILVLSVEIAAIRLSSSAVSRLECKLAHALQLLETSQSTICRLNILMASFALRTPISRPFICVIREEMASPAASSFAPFMR